MTGIELSCVLLALVVGQAAQQPSQVDDPDEQFIAAEPVLRVRPDGPQAAPPAVAKQVPNRKAIRIRYAPAADVAAIVERLLQQESGSDGAERHAVIVADPISNSVLISAAPVVTDQIESIVTTLDRKPALIQVDAALVQVTGQPTAEEATSDSASRTWNEGIEAAIRELRQRGEIRVLARPALMVVDNQAAFIQVGRRQPRLTGVRESPQGRSNQMELENVGLILGVTARSNDDDRITMEIDLEDSRLGPEEQGAVIATTPDGQQVRSPGIDVTTAQTTIRVRDGEAVVAGSIMEHRDDRYGEVWMIVAARFVEQAE